MMHDAREGPRRPSPFHPRSSSVGVMKRSYLRAGALDTGRAVRVLDRLDQVAANAANDGNASSANHSQPDAAAATTQNHDRSEAAA